MLLEPGTHLGPYEILAPAGRGGMGWVYRALDTRLNRLVAIKVLPADLCDNPKLRQRLEREARIISNLLHPHICTLYDIGHQDDVDFLVMEYLEGETIASRLERGAIPIHLALRIAIQIAEALDKAHRNGVVHRDLKPGNVMLTKTGAKLLDFGLAKIQPTVKSLISSVVDTESKPITAEGTVVGTFQYMAPEQIEGQEADARTEVFAFGALLYEMITAQRAFPGKTQASVIGAILATTPPPMAALQPLSPPGLDRTVQICLNKDPDLRWQNIFDVLLQLRSIAEGNAAAASERSSRAGMSPRERVAWAAAVVLPIAAMLATRSFWRTPDVSHPAVRTFVSAPEGALFNLSGDAGGAPVLSPDGTKLAFVAVASDGRSLIWVRSLDNVVARALPETEAGTYPFWSPDGRSLGFFADRKLKRIEVSGGPALSVCDAPTGRGGAWSPKGVIVFAPLFQGGLSQVHETGGAATSLTNTKGSQHTSHRWPFFLPDGRRFVYLAADHSSPQGDSNGVYLGSLDGGLGGLVVKGTSNAVYAAGYLLYSRENSLIAQPFDANSGRTTGSPRPTAEKVQYDGSTWRGIFTASANGVLAYQEAAASGEPYIVWVNRSGKEIGPVMEGSGPQSDDLSLDLSPDGQRLVVELQEVANSDIWVYELARGVRTRVTFGTSDDISPVWSPEGTRIAYASTVGTDHYRLFEKNADGSGKERQLAVGQLDVWPTDWSPDGRYLLYTDGDFDGKTTGKLWVLPLLKDAKPYRLTDNQFAEFEGQFSPDGRWIAFASLESGKSEVYVAAFFPDVPGPPAQALRKWQVSATGGTRPRWRRDGKELYFVSLDNTLMAARVKTSGIHFEAERPQALFTTNIKPHYLTYDSARDGERFALIRVGGRRPLALVLHWASTLP